MPQLGPSHQVAKAWNVRRIECAGLRLLSIGLAQPEDGRHPDAGYALGRSMAQAGLKTETITGLEATTAKQTGVNWPNFELPKLAASDLCHDLFEETCITLARGASEYSMKMVDAINANANNIFEFAGELANARSWPEVVAAYTSQGRKQFDVFSTQAQELSALARKVTIDALAPITSALPKMLETAAALS